MSKETFLLASLTKFFEEPENKQKLHAILGDKGVGPSLRRIEWFVTNYSKNNHVSYTAPNGKMFTVHVAYKSSLDGYSKSFSILFVGRSASSSRDSRRLSDS